MKATNSNGSLNLVAKSWEKDANGLFDYTNKNVKNSIRKRKRQKGKKRRGRKNPRLTR